MLSMARLILERYGVHGSRLRLLQADRQIVYEVFHRSGRFILRLYPPGTIDPGVVRSQCVWLRALAKDTKLSVPEPVASDTGDDVVAARDGDPRRWHATLTRRVPGRPRFKPTGPGTAVMRQVGRLMATLHEHGRRFKPPRGFRFRRWDFDGLFGDSSPWRPVRAMRIDAPTRRLFARVMRRVCRVMRDLGRGPDVFGLIHADLTQANYVMHRGRVHAIDFGDFGRGYFLYDLAVTLLMIRPFDKDGRQRASLIAGYREVRPLTVEHEALLDTFIAARAVALARWIFGAREPGEGDLRWAMATMEWVERIV